MSPKRRRIDKGRPARWPWAALLFGGWWALSRGLLVAGTVAVSLPFLLLWHGQALGAASTLGIAHVLLARLAGRRPGSGSCLLRPIALPVTVVGTCWGLGWALEVAMELLGAPR